MSLSRFLLLCGVVFSLLALAACRFGFPDVSANLAIRISLPDLPDSISTTDTAAATSRAIPVETSSVRLTLVPTEGDTIVQTGTPDAERIVSFSLTDLKPGTVSLTIEAFVDGISEPVSIRSIPEFEIRSGLNECHYGLIPGNSQILESMESPAYFAPARRTTYFEFSVGTAGTWILRALPTSGALATLYNADGLKIAELSSGADLLTRFQAAAGSVYYLGVYNNSDTLQAVQVERQRLPDGLADSSFDSDGLRALGPTTAADWNHAVVARGPGNLVYQVASNTNGYGSCGGFTIRRYTVGVSDLTLDTSYGAGGQAFWLAPYGEFQLMLRAAVVDAGGGLLVAGNYGAAAPQGTAFIARFDPAGGLDRSFGIDGVAIVAPDADMYIINDLAIDGQGRVVACGRNNSKNGPFVAWYSAVGVLQSADTQSTGSYANHYWNCLWIDPADGVLLAGGSDLDTGTTLLVRYSSTQTRGTPLAVDAVASLRELAEDIIPSSVANRVLILGAGANAGYCLRVSLEGSATALGMDGAFGDSGQRNFTFTAALRGRLSNPLARLSAFRWNSTVVAGGTSYTDPNGNWHLFTVDETTLGASSTPLDLDLHDIENIFTAISGTVDQSNLLLYNDEVIVSTVNSGQLTLHRQGHLDNTATFAQINESGIPGAIIQPSWFNQVVSLPDGRTAAAGGLLSASGENRGLLMVFGADGTTDSFGMVIGGAAGGNNEFHCIEPVDQEGDGVVDYLAVGGSYYNITYGSTDWVGLYDMSGTLLIAETVRAEMGITRDLLYDRDTNRLLVVGTGYSSGPFLAGCSIPSLALDASFGDSNGIVNMANIPMGMGQTIARRRDGKLVFMAKATETQPTEHHLVLLDANGSSFEAYKYFTFGVGDYPNEASCLSLQSDNLVLVAGDMLNSDTVGDNSVFVAAIQLDGSLFSEALIFGGNYLLKPLTGNTVALGGFALMPDGGFILAGSRDGASGREPWLQGFRSDGSLEPDFGSSGIGSPTDYAYAREIYSLALHRDGRVVLAGKSSEWANADRSLLLGVR